MAAERFVFAVSSSSRARNGLSAGLLRSKDLEWPRMAVTRASLIDTLEMGGRGSTSRHRPARRACSAVLAQHWTDAANSDSLNHTIFEGTSEIQQLVISRAISGLRIE